MVCSFSAHLPSSSSSAPACSVTSGTSAFRPGWFRKPSTGHGAPLTYSLLGSGAAVSTLSLAERPELAIKEEAVLVPAKNNKTRKLNTVSKKEILLALLHPGRLTEFRGKACDVQALVDHVGIRQNTVIWAEVLEWGWPEGGPAKWNSRYWVNGTPKLRTPLHKALNDMFFEQGKYEIGCYAATKVVFAQGALDYYRRVKGDARYGAHRGAAIVGRR
jgi:hypothetical protein